jgi:site-specific DNA recombinase
MSTYVYARISKDSEKSLSIDDQLKRIAAFMVAKDLKVDEAFIDRGASGRTLKRPEIQRLLAKLQKGDTLIVYKLDRLTRSIRDLGELLERKFDLISVAETLDTSSAAGRMVVSLLGVFAQWERETISERTVHALSYRREAKRRYGATPYGWKLAKGQLVINDLERPALNMIRVLEHRGVRVAEIVRQLESQFPSAARGARWYPATVRSILKSKMFNEIQESAS